jgi:hypothetical protein
LGVQKSTFEARRHEMPVRRWSKSLVVCLALVVLSTGVGGCAALVAGGAGAAGGYYYFKGEEEKKKEKAAPKKESSEQGERKEAQ